MSSEPESKQPQIDATAERRAKITRLIEEYSVKLGLGKLPANNDVEKYLNLTQAELRRMSAEECGEAAYFISRAMTYIQLECNKIQADMNWCNQYIQWIVSKTLMSVGGQYMPVEYKRLLAIQQNDTAQSLYKIVVTAQARLDSMAFVTTQLRGILTSFEGLQQTKRNQK